jgi:hypothetical protein
VQELMKGGEVQRHEAQSKVDDLLERSRKSTEALLSLVHAEVSHQLSSLGIGSLEDLARQVASVLGRGTSKAPATKTGSTAKKAGAKKAGAKKAAAKKSPAKKSTAKKSTAKKSTAKKAPAKKAAAKKASAKKAAAKKAAPGSGSAG